MHDVKRVGFSVEQAVLDIGVKIVDETIRYCGGEGRIIIPSVIL